MGEGQILKVVAAIIIKNDKVLIARRAAHKKMPGKWEFPGGKVEAGETPELALEREIYEEFGVQVQTKEFVHTNLYDYGSFKIELMAFNTSYISGEFELTDHDRIEWVRPEMLESYDLTEADLPIIPFIVTDEN